MEKLIVPESNEISFQDARVQLAKSLKELVTAHEVKIAGLRARELKKSNGGKVLLKSELCLLCANANSACTCLSKAQKGDCFECGKPIGSLTGGQTMMDHGKPICGSCNRKPPLHNAPKKDGDVPEKLKIDKSELCKSCNKSEPLCKCKMVKEELKSDPSKSVKVKVKVVAKAEGGMCAQDKSTYYCTLPKAHEGRCKGPKHVSDEEFNKDPYYKEQAKKLGKDELPIVKPAPEKAVKGAKLPKAGKKIEAEGSGGQVTETKKSELRKDTQGGPFKKPGTVALPGMAKPAGPPAGVVGIPGKQPVGQGGGDAFKVPSAAAPTSPEQANKEMGGFKSIASSPVRLPGMGAKLMNAPKPAAPVAGNNLKPVSGTIMARKDEKDPAPIKEPKKQSVPVRGREMPLHQIFARIKKPVKKSETALLKSMGNCAICNKAEHLGACK
jgi:hypothetical protein